MILVFVFGVTAVAVGVLRMDSRVMRDRNRARRVEHLAALEKWYDNTYYPRFQMVDPKNPHAFRVVRRPVPLLDDIDLRLGTMEAMAIVNHSTEAAYATKVDDKGRTNIVSQHFVPQAEVTAMAARADADITAITGPPSATTSGNVIKKGI